MNTTDIYSQIILEKIIKDYLQQGVVPSIEEIELVFNEFISNQDLSSSNFTANEWQVEKKEISSAQKFNKMTEEMKQDITVLYKSLLENSLRSSQLFQKWSLKTTQLENRIKALESKIARLLLRESDTSGYFQFVGDKFTSTDLIDLENTSGLLIDLNQNLVGIAKSDQTTIDRLFFNDILENQLKFNLITKNSIISAALTDNTQLKYCLLDSALYWKTKIVSKSKQNIIAELIIDFQTEQTFNTIKIDLHSSQSNSVTRITPLVSSDGINFTRLSSINEVGEGVDKISFQFESTTATKIKFILEKSSPDYIEDDNFIYEFGAEEISFFSSTFALNDESVLISKPMSLTLPDNNKYQFNKISLDACEGVPEETSINYFVSVGKTNASEEVEWLTDSGFFVETDSIEERLWLPINPMENTDNAIPKILDLVTLSAFTISGIAVSFDPDDSQISPASEYNLVYLNGDTIDFSVETSTANRYVFGNRNQVALNYQIDKDLSIAKQEMKLWRNVGSRGLSSTDITSKVRGVQQGWQYDAPYYKTTVLISGSNGLTIDIGNSLIEIDGKSYKNVVSSEVLSPGIHKIKVHKNNWNAIDPNINSLQELKSKDVLYPFNHKLLIEGYQYGDTWDSSEEKIYKGVDRFAESICNLVSVFDINMSNVRRDIFAFDTDLVENVSGLSDIIIINTDTSQGDFVNETFVLEFVLTDQLFDTIALKAVFSTENETISPILDEYKIKLGL